MSKTVPAGALAIAMQQDLRIAAVDSEFGIPAAKLFIAYAPDSVKRLIDLVGPANARMILYTARVASKLKIN